MTKDKSITQLLMYDIGDGRTKIEVEFDFGENTLWLSQAQLIELFNTSKQNISLHINNVLNDKELDRFSVVKENLTTAKDGKRYQVSYYNLDMIIAIGYRVKSNRGTQFRKWATSVLQEYIRKGFAMNDDLLKQAGGGIYFKELLNRIRDIRSSEKVFYRQILDIYATSIDYDSKAKLTQDFFKIVQNKMHYAVHGHTAAELIMSRADSEKPFMGLTAFFGNKPRRDEVMLAKNYLSENEIKDLNLLVSSYLDFAERQANRKIPMYMKDWLQKLDEFLNVSGDQVLHNAGKISQEQAIEHAENEYDKYQEKSVEELTQVEKDFLDTIKRTYKMLEGKKKE